MWIRFGGKREKGGEAVWGGCSTMYGEFLGVSWTMMRCMGTSDATTILRRMMVYDRYQPEHIIQIQLSAIQNS